jgi:hypothetical protein
VVICLFFAMVSVRSKKSTVCERSLMTQFSVPQLLRSEQKLFHSVLSLEVSV